MPTTPKDRDEWSNDTVHIDEAPDVDADAFPSAKTTITKMSFAPGERPADVIPIKAQRPAQPAPARPAPRSELDAQKLSKLKSLQIGSSSDERTSSVRKPPVRWGRWLFLLILAGGGYAGYRNWPRLRALIPQGSSSGTPGGAPEANGPRVETVRATQRAETSVAAAGYVAAQDLITIGTTVSGRVKAVVVTNGQRVKRGQLLVQLDDSELRGELGLATAKLRDAQRTLKRYQSLYKLEAATLVDVDKARGQVDVSHAEVGVIYPRMKQMRMVAPTDGTVIDVLARPGEVLTPSAGATVGIVKFADLSKLGVEADVPQSDIPLVHLGDHATVELDSFPDKQFEGKVREMATEADRAKGTVTVKITLAPDPKLQPGMSAKVRIVVSGQGAPQILLAKEAVVNDLVWVVVDGKARRRAVTSRPAGGGQVEIARGLTAGERVVTAGFQGLAEGDSVGP